MPPPCVVSTPDVLPGQRRGSFGSSLGSRFGSWCASRSPESPKNSRVVDPAFDRTAPAARPRRRRPPPPRRPPAAAAASPPAAAAALPPAAAAGGAAGLMAAAARSRSASTSLPPGSTVGLPPPAAHGVTVGRGGVPPRTPSAVAAAAAGRCRVGLLLGLATAAVAAFALGAAVAGAAAGGRPPPAVVGWATGAARGAGAATRSAAGTVRAIVGALVGGGGGGEGVAPPRRVGRVGVAPRPGRRDGALDGLLAWTVRAGGGGGGGDGLPPRVTPPAGTHAADVARGVCGAARRCDGGDGGGVGGRVLAVTRWWAGPPPPPPVGPRVAADLAPPTTASTVQNVRALRGRGYTPAAPPAFNASTGWAAWAGRGTVGGVAGGGRPRCVDAGRPPFGLTVVDDAYVSSEGAVLAAGGGGGGGGWQSWGGVLRGGLGRLPGGGGVGGEPVTVVPGDLFVLAAHHAATYFHVLTEVIPRVLAFLPFLRAHPHMLLAVSASDELTVPFLGLLGVPAGRVVELPRGSWAYAHRLLFPPPPPPCPAATPSAPRRCCPPTWPPRTGSAAAMGPPRPPPPPRRCRRSSSCGARPPPASASRRGVWPTLTPSPPPSPPASRPPTRSWWRPPTAPLRRGCGCLGPPPPSSACTGRGWPTPSFCPQTPRCFKCGASRTTCTGGWPTRSRASRLST
ncbi:hypothetical protein BU14_0717s0008 [Porphyra umbilicalis]|uniref:Uncharacterized protein n=1 Tax=Porphyra umbilicalis TaxID=2786 RepID=A0A1X6NPR1_PORUM|nr:hypothetical protein BU14_0717s0008 [Porphyra umbilicalis]|eukprot:OSX70581.1 hypothetical protein BU14_0717s0008 [Porphyra umbilicalis]